MNDRLDFRPMEPLPAASLPASPDYIFQVKWDGVRMISLLNRDTVKLFNKRGRERTAQYPELQKLRAAFEGRRVIVDGEIVVMKRGYPVFPSVMQRDNARIASRISGLQYSLPVDYVIFDLLQIEHEPLFNLPLEERLSRLRELFNPQAASCFYLIDSFGDGQALLREIEQAGLEGIVAKNRLSPYLPGKKHHHWFKIKVQQQIRCKVGGYVTREGKIKSLLLGIEQEGELIFVGKASSGINESGWHELAQGLEYWRVAASPFAHPVPLSRQETAHFVQPILEVIIEYLEWTPQMHLRHPVIKGFAIANQL